jgi:hypothetical protein
VLKLKSDIPLSTFALKFNLRRYSPVDPQYQLPHAPGGAPFPVLPTHAPPKYPLYPTDRSAHPRPTTDRPRWDNLSDIPGRALNCNRSLLQLNLSRFFPDPL